MTTSLKLNKTEDDALEVRAAQSSAPPFNLVDSAMFAVMSNAVRLFPRGWGEVEVMRFVERRFLEAKREVEPIHVTWTTLPHTTRDGIMRMRGFFESPASGDLPLPPATRPAYFEMLLPEGTSVTLKPPVCLHFAATGDEGFFRRRAFVKPLLQRGIGAVILENPYYGLRRPATQKNIGVASVADQMMMSHAAVEEGLALLKWLRDDGYDHLGVSGYSMGGYTASYIAALSDEALAAIPIATGASPAPVFTQSPLARIPDWSALGGSRGRDLLRALLGTFSIKNLPRPVDPDLAILVSGRRDAIVPPSQVRALARHWGSRVYWTPNGHLTGYWNNRRLIHEVICEAFGMLMARDHQPTK